MLNATKASLISAYTTTASMNLALVSVFSEDVNLVQYMFELQYTDVLVNIYEDWLESMEDDDNYDELPAFWELTDMLDSFFYN